MSASDGVVRRDPALGLLDRLVRDALDQGYHDAAARGPRPDGTVLQRHGVAALGLALVAAVLTIGAVTQVVGAPDAAARKQELAATIAGTTARVEALEAQARTTAADVAALQQQALGSGASGRAVQDQVVALDPAVGTGAVAGPGVVVTVDDATTAEAEGTTPDADLGRVLDRDLQQVVNGLWAAGAEAVAINGQRLTSLSAIRGAGDAILVNYRPLVRPYVVTAIGPPSTLRAQFQAGAAGVQLDALRQAYGLRYDVRSEDQVTLPGEPGVVLRAAEEGSR